MLSTASLTIKPAKFGGASVSECGGGGASWNTLSLVLLITSQQDPPQLTQSTLRHRTR